MTVRQFCTFHLAGRLFGIDVRRVQEVLTEQAITPVPLASDVVRGLINLRGQIVTAIDLGRRLQLNSTADAAPRMNVVVRVDDGAVSLLVEAMGDVVEVDDEQLEAPPDTLDAGGLVSAVRQLPTELLLLLDVDRVVDFDARLARETDDQAGARVRTSIG